MGKDKGIELLKHLEDRTFYDEPCRIILPWHNRGLLSFLHTPGDWGSIAEKIVADSFSLHQVAWFPDANVAIRDDTAPVWDALRLAILRSSNASVIFTSVVHNELKEWLNSPYRNKDLAHAIRTAISNETWASKFCIANNLSILPAVLGYACLLGQRRIVANPTPSGLTMFGTDAKAKDVTMNAIDKALGRRALGLAKKGRIDAEKNNQTVKLNDELHCLTAVCYSLLTGKESVILTADQDLIEIFWKVQWFFNTHYRAYLAAKLVKDGQFGEPAKVLENTHGYFDGPLTMYRRRTRHLQEVLPSINTPVPVYVTYVAPDNMTYTIGFEFNREMLDMLEVRSRTSGRCTDLFGEENIHVDLGPLKPGLDGSYLEIGRDAGWWAPINETKIFSSRLDIEHSLHCQERMSRP